MSNLLKRGTTISKNERVIDYNELIREKMQAVTEIHLKKADPDGFISGINATVVEELSSGEDDNIDGIAQDMTGMTSETAAKLLEEANEQASEIINQANAEANKVLEEANEESARISEDARNRGYEEGLRNAQSEIDSLKQQLEEEYNSKVAALTKETEEYKKKLEPELVDVITDVFRSVILTVAEDNQEIILHLINGVMRNVDNSHDFVIKVSSQDYRFLIDNQGKIYTAISKDINIDIVEDSTMERNQCIIETDTGVFNCGLDIELNNLIKKIKLLSCI
ncbi:MAG: FliH/SctL family protein [Lachnospira sp.]